MNSSLLHNAYAFYKTGNLPEAARLCSEVLRADPHNFDGLCVMGLIQARRGQLEEAHRLAVEAIRRNSTSGRSLYLLGYLLQSLGRHDEAIEIYRKSLAQGGDRFAGLIQSGCSLLELKRYSDALDAFDRALVIKSDEAGAWNNRGNALLWLEHYNDALESYDKALAINSGYAEAWESRGNALWGLNRHEDALASFDSALQSGPGRGSLWAKRGNLLHILGRHEDALASDLRSLSFEPNNVMVLLHCGLVQKLLRRQADAIRSFERALTIDTSNAEVLYQLGELLNELTRYSEALPLFDRSLTLKPNNPDALISRSKALLALMDPEGAVAACTTALSIDPERIEALVNRGTALMTLKRFDEAAADYKKALLLDPACRYVRGLLIYCELSCCDWRNLPVHREAVAAALRGGKGVIPPFVNLAFSHSPADQLQCARIWTAEECPPSQVPLWRGERYRRDRIRIAYLSADYGVQPVPILIAGLFEHHDRNRFETIAIAYGPDDKSEMRARLEVGFDRFIDVRSKSDLEVASMLREMEVEVAVDLMGFTRYCRTGILALRPAPIQVNYLGYPGTMGADYMDYIIADRILIPETHQRHYSEKIVYLPDTYQPNDLKRRPGGRTPTRTEVGLPEREFVFCCFNNGFKITPETFAIWMRLLRRRENSVLWLLEDNATATRNLKSEAAACGVVPERLVFAPRIDAASHLARLPLADLFLDTQPYGGHTTASDALWMGLPVVTSPGETFASRVASSLLNAIGLPQLIAPSFAAYESLALQLAQDEATLSGLKAKLAGNRLVYPLFQTEHYTRLLEAAYQTMWERYQRGERPEHFSVRSALS